jgi:hypothetical protein
MNSTHTPRRGIIGLATTVLVAGGLGLASLALAGTAHADYYANWCPGQPIPGDFAPEDVNWDSSVCHKVLVIPDPGSLVLVDPGVYQVIAGNPNSSCLRAAFWC